MWLTKTCKYFFNASLLLFVVHSQGHEDCSLSVMSLKKKINLTVGESLTLNCSIHYCALKGPVEEAYWCEVSQNNCKHTHTENKDFGNSSRMFMNYIVSSVNLNDSGTYQCQAKQGADVSVGHSITVQVQEKPTEAPRGNSTIAAVKNTTMSSTGPSMQTPTWILFCLIGLGVVAAIIFIVMITYFCLRNLEGNNLSDTLESKEDRKRSKHNTMEEANGNSTIYENELPQRLRFSHPNSIFASTNINHPTPSPSRPYPNEVCVIDVPVDDPIIYASLSDSILTRHRSIIRTVDETTEYAAINIKV